MNQLGELVAMVQDRFDGPRPEPVRIEYPTVRSRIPQWVPQESLDIQHESVDVHPEDEFCLQEPGNWGKQPTIGTIISEVPDTLAYYLPFHFHKNTWGIYIHDTGVLQLGTYLKGGPVPSPDDLCLSVARLILLKHETLHHECEVAASFGELASQESWYNPYFCDWESGLIEEAVANANALRWLTGGLKCFLPAVRTWMSGQPPGYRDYDSYLWRKSFREGQLKLSRQMWGARHRGLRPPPTPWPGGLLWSDLGESNELPVRLVLGAASPLTVRRPFPKNYGIQVFVHSNDHEPPHFHLFAPPGREHGRVLWPCREPYPPYPGDPALPRPLQRKLKKYLEKHGADIKSRIEAVPWGKATC